MFPVTHYIKGMVKNLFNPRVSFFSFVSANNTIDPKAVIYRMVKMKGSSIGRYSYVGNGTDVESADIGQFCSISDHCRIGMGGHTLSCLSTCPVFTQRVNGCQSQWVVRDAHSVKAKRTVLGNDVWVGSHVLINGGVTVGDGAVIGAGAVVVKDVPPYAIVGGVPAKVIRYRFPEDIIAKLEELRWWNLPEEKLKEHISVFQNDKLTMEELNTLDTLAE